MNRPSPSGPVGAEHRERVPALARGADPRRDQLRERAVDRVERAEAGDAAHRRGARHHDLGDRAGLRQHVDRPERARGVRDLDAERRADGLVDARLDERARAVERARDHRRGLGQVGGDLVAVDRDRGRDRHVSPLDPVRVEVVGEGRRAVGPAGDLLPDEPLGVLDEAGHERARAARCRSGAASSWSARSATEVAATWAARSPSVIRGMRTFARITSKIASTGSPRS